MNILSNLESFFNESEGNVTTDQSKIMGRSFQDNVTHRDQLLGFYDLDSFNKMIYKINPTSYLTKKGYGRE